MTQMKNEQSPTPSNQVVSNHCTTKDSPSDVDAVAKEGHGGHNWLMMACCVPMILIAIGLVFAGVVSVSYLIYAVGCLGMMFMMMRMMDHGGMKM